MLYSPMMTVFFNEDTGNVTLLGSELGILSVDLNNINLDGANFDKDDPETVIHVRIQGWNSN